MFTKAKRNWKKWLCAGLTAILLLEGAGCGFSQDGGMREGESQAVSLQIEGSQQAEGSLQAGAGGESQDPSGNGVVDEKKTVNAEAISDYYEYVNADWIRGQEEKEQRAYCRF